MTAIIIVLFLASAPISGVRWLRVAQREHYLAGEVTRFAIRWWNAGRANAVLIAVAVAAAVAALWFAPAAVVSIEIVALGPLGLSMRGRTSPLVWTRRLKTVTAVAVSLVVVVMVVAVLLGLGVVGAGACAIALPLIVDLALLLLTPVERRAAAKFVTSARERLDRVAPLRVAITGSYGKTTIKGYVRHLSSTTHAVVASPASFNNTGGLSRTVNEMMGPDTEVFVAEMGTYGPGEIRDLCSWVKPDIAVLCNIGPVHLERFGSLDVIVSSKSEIFETASTAIVNIDAYGLAAVAEQLRSTGKRVMTCSEDTDSGADIVVTDGHLTVAGEAHEVRFPETAAPINVACAVAVARALDVPLSTIVERLPTIPGADHRCEVSTSPAGVVVVDDTYNSNPTGAAAALDTLMGVDAKRRVLVTPGMVELGTMQAQENQRFAANASKVLDDVIVVGDTNRAALTAGAAQGAARLHEVRYRTEAVEWVKANLGPGDAVLYENDLPDHYP